jgi:hypothetical protein
MVGGTRVHDGGGCNAGDAVVPLSANLAGIAITACGLAVIASDGLVALIAIAFSAGTFTLLVRHLLS